MFQNLSERLSATLRGWTGRTVLTEANLEETLQEVKIALIDADAGVEVAQGFINRVKTAALGQKIETGLSPGQFFIQLLHRQLVELMGQEAVGLSLRQATPVVILMAGLQGSGKTTSAAKLAKRLKEEDKKSVSVVSCDIYRPAAIFNYNGWLVRVVANLFPKHRVEGQPKSHNGRLRAPGGMAMDA